MCIIWGWPHSFIENFKFNRDRPSEHHEIQFHETPHLKRGGITYLLKELSLEFVLSSIEFLKCFSCLCVIYNLQNLSSPVRFNFSGTMLQFYMTIWEIVSSIDLYTAVVGFLLAQNCLVLCTESVYQFYPPFCFSCPLISQQALANLKTIKIVLFSFILIVVLILFTSIKKIINTRYNYFELS